ncbi:Tcf3 fusion partner-like protein [Plakobranchus ocellatus]|uniref:Tcf3 fusion partner-like protein n=1 Tax=Plakobranchus ocellatus TaxID=259542 RepID=A0AAV4D1F8_9GAST|nr:Tcf3 fusion partner-like protein [Plakobranchus ocellatus]
MVEPEDAANLKAQLEVISKETAFLKKYFALRKRCEQLQQSNEKMVNRIQHVKKLVKRYKRDKRYLAARLDEHGDNFRDAQVPLMWEEDQLFGNIRRNKHFASAGSDSEAEGKARMESKSAMSSIQPLLQAHGMGNADPSSKSKKVKTEKEKDPNAPKKPANAFLMFCTTQRTTVQEEYFKEHKEEIAHHELTKSLAHQWNALVPEEKRIYYEMYEREKERYEREMRVYKPKADPSAGDASTSAAAELNTSSADDSLSFKEELDI